MPDEASVPLEEVLVEINEEFATEESLPLTPTAVP